MQSSRNPIVECKLDRMESTGPCHWMVFRVTLGEPEGESTYQAGDYEWFVPAAGNPLTWDPHTGSIRGGTDPMLKKVS